MVDSATNEAIVRVLRSVAEAWARGAAWEHLGEPELAADQVRELMRTHEPLFRHELEQAKRHALAICEGEGLGVLRILMRSEDDAVRREAAKQALAHARHLGTRPTADPASASPVLLYVNNMTDAELDQYEQAALKRSAE